MYKYYNVARMVEPKRKLLAEAQVTSPPPKVLDTPTLVLETPARVLDTPTRVSNGRAQAETPRRGPGYLPFIRLGRLKIESDETPATLARAQESRWPLFSQH